MAKLPKKGVPVDNGQMVEGVLTERQRGLLLETVRGSKLQGYVIKSLVDQLELFKPTDLLPGRLDWARLERDAERRHCSMADALWDLPRTKGTA